MPADLDAVAARLYADVMAPLVLGGTVRPGHAIGGRGALAFGEEREPPDAELAARVDAARIRSARRLAPIDAVAGPRGVDWALAAIFHDLLQAANPVFDAPLRRGAARRILAIAAMALEHVPPLANAADALARHGWLGRAVDVARMDTAVHWWTGTREYRGVEPPERLKAWPRVRRVSLVRTPRRLLEMTPLAVDRDQLAAAFAGWLGRTPLTDLATCTRGAPVFAWTDATLGLIATDAGRTLALRALARLPVAAVDAALGAATRQLFTALAQKAPEPGPRRRVAPAVVALLAERALLAASRLVQPNRDSFETALSTPELKSFAMAVGAIGARRALAGGEGPWTDAQRTGLIERLSHVADSTIGREARRLTATAERLGKQSR